MIDETPRAGPTKISRDIRVLAILDDKLLWYMDTL